MHALVLSVLKRFDKLLNLKLSSFGAGIVDTWQLSSRTIRHLADWLVMGRKTYRDARGYLRFKDSGRLVHRWAAEKSLGRRLMPGEVVHHKNSFKTDNRRSNLRVFRSSSEHRIHHIRKAWDTRKRRTVVRKRRGF